MFRAWYYFRMGWSTYFAFILAAINTLTVTYFLAIDNYPSLKTIFPSFEVYIMIVVTVGIPLLILVGYSHYKRTLAFKSEVDVVVESNPYQRRNIVNATITVELTIKNLELLIKLANKEQVSDEDLAELKKLHQKYVNFLNEREFSNKKDMEFIKEEVSNS
jgi:hypothetical protein